MTRLLSKILFQSKFFRKWPNNYTAIHRLVSRSKKTLRKLEGKDYPKQSRFTIKLFLSLISFVGKKAKVDPNSS